MIRVLHLITSMPVGGAENLVLTIMRKLDPDKFVSVLCCIRELGVMGEEARRDGFNVVELNRMRGRGFDLKAIRKIMDVILSNKIDIVHCHFFHASMYGRISALLTRVPSVITSHNVYSRVKWHRRVINWGLSHLTSRVICVSGRVKEDVRKFDWISESKLVTVFNGIDIASIQLAHPREQAKEMLGIQRGAVVIGCIARLERAKGHRFLFDALASLRQLRGECPYLVLVGMGSEYDGLREYGDQLGLTDRIIYLGMRRDIPSVLASFDIFVLPSLWEGLPLALLEAMASGVPVIASDVGGIGDVLDGGRFGVLVPPGDMIALRDSINGMLNQPERRESVGLLGRMRSEERYGASAMVRQLGEIYMQAYCVI